MPPPGGKVSGKRGSPQGNRALEVGRPGRRLPGRGRVTARSFTTPKSTGKVSSSVYPKGTTPRQNFAQIAKESGAPQARGVANLFGTLNQSVAAPAGALQAALAPTLMSLGMAFEGMGPMGGILMTLGLVTGMLPVFASVLGAPARATAAPTHPRAAALGFKMAWNHASMWHTPAPGSGGTHRQIPVLNGNKVTVLQTAVTNEALNGKFKDARDMIVSKGIPQSDPVASTRLIAMLHVAQSAYKSLPNNHPSAPLMDHALTYIISNLDNTAYVSEATYTFTWSQLSYAIAEASHGATTGTITEHGNYDVVPGTQ